MSSRRTLLMALCAAALWAPLRVRAQSPARISRIGYLVTSSAANFAITVEPFKRRMRELGYREGTDFVLELRTADGKLERLSILAAELARLDVDVIVASSTPGAQAAMRATRAIPIVVANSSDPVASGLVRNLARPGGNVTGLSNLQADLGRKQLEILKAAIPSLSKVAVLVHPANETTLLLASNIREAGRKLRVETLRIDATEPAEIEKAFNLAAAARAQALIVTSEGFFMQYRRQLAESGLKHRVPTVFGQAEFVEAGGLLSYGPDLTDNFGRAAEYVDRILKGAKPGDLPIQQPIKFELLINVRTARALGLTVSDELRLRADRLVE